MLLISHRGNLDGPNPEKENHPNYVGAALYDGYHVEVDVWYVDGEFVLGHDAPTYQVGYQWFYNSRLWCHCKNIEALYKLSPNPLVNAFMHGEDDAVLTSQNYIWTYPKSTLKLTDKSIAVLPERTEEWPGLNNCFGICTDYVNKVFY